MTLSRKIAHTIIEQSVQAETLLHVLSKYKLQSLLPSIVAEMKKLMRSLEGDTSLRIESPFALNEQALAHIISITGAQGEDVKQSLNENVLSEFKARYKGKLYDGSGERIVQALIRN